MTDHTTDHAKRTTLKRMSALVAGSAATGLVANAVAAPLPTNCDPAELLDDSGIGSFELRTRVSSTRNDVEVVLTNTGEHAATITQMTPYETLTRRGRFVFGDLFDDSGHLTLAAGQSVTVPMTPHAVVLDGATPQRRAISLADTLRRGASIMVDGTHFAPVTVVSGSVFA